MKKNALYIILFVPLFLISSIFKGVCSDSLFINIHTDQKVYVVGEKIWIDGEAFNATLSKYISIELIDRNGISKGPNFLYLVNSRFSGYVKVPEDCKTDFYFLRYKLQKEKTITSLYPLILINPQIQPEFCSNPYQFNINKNYTTNSPKQISLNKQEYLTNEWVNAKINEDSLISDISIYVRRKDKISDYADSILSTINEYLASNRISSNTGEQRIRIKITSATTGLPVAKVKVWASVISQKSRISYGISSENGEVLFDFPIIYGESKIVFSQDESSDEKVNIELLDETFSESKFSFPCLQLNENMREDIEERLLNVQLQEKYGLDKITNIVYKENDTTDFYGNAKLIYFLDDYVRFPDMRDIFSEIIPEIRLKNAESDKPKFQILDQGSKDYFEKNALTLIDGVPVKNNKQLLNIDALKIKSIEVIDRKFYLGDETFYGIIHFKTYNNDLSGFILPERDIIYPFSGIQFYCNPVFKKSKERKSEYLPDFRNLLYREIHNSKKDNNSFNFQFLTSKATGNFEIEIIARTKSGAYKHYTNNFNVNPRD